MSIIGRVADEVRAGIVGITNPRDPAFWLQKLFGGGETPSGVAVNEESAMTISAVWNAINIISGALGFLPFNVYRRLPDGGREKAVNHPTHALIHDRPNPYMDAGVFRETLQAHILAWGNGYAEIERNNNGQARALWPLRPDRTVPELFGKDRNVKVRYRHTKESGGTVIIPFEDMFHVRGLGATGLQGYSVISRFARDSLGAAKAAELYSSRFFKNDATPPMVLKHPGRLGDTAEEHLRKSWQENHSGENRHKPSILEEGMDIQTLGLSPEDAQLLMTRQFDVIQVARWFDIPPHMIKSLEKATFSNIEQQGLEFVIWTLTKWLTRWEAEVNFKLFGKEDRSVFFSEFVTAALLRGDTKSRFDAYRVAINSGWMARNEVRAIENMNKVDGLDAFWQPLNVQSVGGSDSEEPDMVVEVITEGNAGRQEAENGDEVVETVGDVDLNVASEDLFRTTWGRIVTKEVNALRSKIDKPDSREKINAFYDKHFDHVREVLGPVLRIFGTGPGRVEVVARQYIEDSRADLLAAIDAGDDVREMVAEWRANKGLRMAEEFFGKGSE